MYEPNKEEWLSASEYVCQHFNKETKSCMRNKSSFCSQETCPIEDHMLPFVHMLHVGYFENEEAIRRQEEDDLYN